MVGILTGSLMALLLTLISPASSLSDNTTAPITTTTTTNSTTTSWRAEPNGRGTFSLVFSCIVTLTLCVWSALHLNVPAEHKTSRGQILEKAKWVLYGIFAPELVVATAAAQFIVARWLMREISKDAKYRLSADITPSAKDPSFSSQTWDMTQCFYAVMGGFAVDIPWTKNYSQHSDHDDPRQQRVTIAPEGIRLLSLLGRLPQIHESQIQDKSKADWMAKTIICTQAGWMLLQVLGRVAKNMPVSLLEINTCGHVLCALVIYLLWWNKPLDINVPTLLASDDDSYKDHLSLMYLCSAISGDNDITDIRCFMHVASDERFLWQPLSRQEEVAAIATAAVKSADSPIINGSDISDGDAPKPEITTYLSIGSPGSRNPSQFLGFSELWAASRPATTPRRDGDGDTKTIIDAMVNKPLYNSSHSYRYKFDPALPAIAPECLIYFSPPYTHAPQPSLRHSRYCRRIYLPENAKINASAERQNHPPIPPNFSPQPPSPQTISAPRMGSFLGETDYLVTPSMANLPSLHNLSLGQVNIHRDTLRSVLALTAAAYGALHCAGWDDNHSYLFPTRVERAIWVGSAVTIASSGALLWAFFSARRLWPAFDHLWVPEAYFTGSKVLTPWQRRWKCLVGRAKLWGMYVVLGLFALARVYLVAEAFVSLRTAPVGLYDTPEWTDFLPHL
ncbi:hypothetical protein B0T17DRAFT_532864 [Bombardia bombarda]|uniref:Uncharacterized protein n=1 Tax=Bombardia bombarda TaxID=252184 RepID=A0AA39X282_9PEZI|nr:hypothetical protein B0T17DRAFT_532864 [Bombardia bombarda]